MRQGLFDDATRNHFFGLNRTPKLQSEGRVAKIPSARFVNSVRRLFPNGPYASNQIFVAIRR